MRLGFVGAGRMGLPMVRRLAAAGHGVAVLGRSPEAREALAEQGARAVAGIAEVGGGADAVLVCVHDDQQVRDVCLGGGLLEGMPDGSVLVVHTTGSPRTIEAIAARAAPRGIQVVDAPVSGGPHDVAAGRLTLFVGGADDPVARIRPVLESYGDPVLHVGPSGAGQLVKLVNNALFAAQIGLLADAVGLGERLGVDEAVLLGALPHASAASRALTGVAGRGSVAGFAAATAEFVGKDVNIVREVAAELGGDLGALGDALDTLAGVLTPAGRPVPAAGTGR
jgi:3-hydroxyisobutyrate dehydrogenase-like beta-hydroxyacid dehydrogenase